MFRFIDLRINLQTRANVLFKQYMYQRGQFWDFEATLFADIKFGNLQRNQLYPNLSAGTFHKLYVDYLKTNLLRNTITPTLPPPMGMALFIEI